MRRVTNEEIVEALKLLVGVAAAHGGGVVGGFEVFNEDTGQTEIWHIDIHNAAYCADAHDFNENIGQMLQ